MTARMFLLNSIQNSVRAAAIAIALVCIAAPASAQVARVVPDSAVRIDSAATLAKVTVSAKSAKSRAARERQLMLGNRMLAKQLASYDRRIAQLEARLDSLRVESAHKWREARDMESAAVEARDRRIALERRLGMLEAADSTKKVLMAGPR